MGNVGVDARRQAANQLTFTRMCESAPALVDIQQAIKVVPGMTRATVLTSGAPMPWDRYYGGQRSAVIGGAIYEGLAKDADEADRLIRSGDILVRPCHDLGCVGSLAGIYTASMPVFVVEDSAHGNRAYCNLFEGPATARLNYGVYNADVRRSLDFLRDVIAPVLAEAVRLSGGIHLKPLMRRAVHMGDELHSRNTAATLLFTRELFSSLLKLRAMGEALDQTLEYLSHSDYFFLRLSMASSKAAADAAHGIEESSVVTAMTFSCEEYAIRVSGLGDTWFRAPLQPAEAKLFEGYTQDDVQYMGGESVINETLGLGGFAQAAAFPLQAYSGGTADEMVRRNLLMYQITVGEHPDFQVPFFGFRGTPTGVDVHKVVSTGITPVSNIGVAGKGGGQIGAGSLWAPLECFQSALAAYEQRYGN